MEKNESIVSQWKKWAIAGGFVALGAVLHITGQMWLWQEMDAVDALGPAGSPGTLFSLGGIATIAGVAVALGGIVMMFVTATNSFGAHRER